MNNTKEMILKEIERRHILLQECLPYCNSESERNEAYARSSELFDLLAWIKRCISNENI